MKQAILSLTEKAKVSDKLLSGLLAFLGSLYLALLSQIALPVPFSPVPETLQTFGLFTLAWGLGWRRGTYAVVLYLIEGTLGAPIFAGGTVNPLWFCGPRVGYLVAFPISVYVMGKLFQNSFSLTLPKIIGIHLLGQLVIYTSGVAGLSLFLPFRDAIVAGVLPFLLGACLKLVASSSLCFAKAHWK